MARVRNTGFRRRPTFNEIGNLKEKKVPPIRRPAAEIWRSFEMGWLKEPLENLQGRAMELEPHQAIRNMAKTEDRQMGLPVAHVIAQRQEPRSNAKASTKMFWN